MHNLLKRRNFLKACLGAGAILATPSALARAISPAERTLAFHNLHTGEDLEVAYWANGDYLGDELTAVNRLLRDFRTGEIHPIDTALLDQLYLLQHQMGTERAFHVISGYRSPQTNASLRSTSSGVAKRSLHMQGKAIDIRLPGANLAELHRTAMAMKAGGVGYYPKSDFIHIDTGRVRYW